MKMFPRQLPRCSALGLVLVLIAVPAVGEDADKEKAKDEPTLTEIVEILRERGLIDDDQHAELAAKAAKEQAKRSWTDRVSIWGDFRARYEGFFYDQDPYADKDDRQRFRYRARLDVKGEVASRATVYFRAVSGDDDPRSTNQTLGGNGPDFDTDDLRLDLAYATISPYPNAELPGVDKGLLAADLGKVPNPFVWKELAQDSMLWDNDITLEGGSLRVHGGSGPITLYSHTGGYAIQENATSKDPGLFASQFGGVAEITDAISIGARGTVYDFFSLDDAFFTRAASGGNIADGLSRNDNPIWVLETSAFLDLNFWELFPIQFFGTYANNLSARSSRAFPGVPRDDDAYAVGLSIGDPKVLVKIGMGWYYIQANAFPSMYIDSDILDGFTNRKGFAWSLERQLFEGVTFVYTAYLSDYIEGSAPYATSVAGSERFRMRADLNFKF